MPHRAQWSRRQVLAHTTAWTLAPPLARADEDPDWMVSRPLPNEARRQELTRAYLAAHLPEGHPHPAAQVHMVPRAIVLHWTGAERSRSAWQTFAPATLGGRPELQGAGALNVATHFLVDRDGSCWRLLPDTRVARHTIGLNHCAIGIENAADGTLHGTSAAPLTDAQVSRNILLVRHLLERHPTITHLLGHHEYRRMETTELFAERDPAYRTTKIDPGEAFMAAVRAGLSMPGVHPPPPAPSSTR